MDRKISLGIIGGSGLYEMEGLSDVKEIRLETPFGDPSDAYIIGKLEGVRVAFLPRHGRGHRISPSELNFRANIFGFKMLGADHIVSVTAVGSLREQIRPSDMVIPDQFFDRTRHRESTFFGNGIVAHISFADPVCPELSRILHQSAEDNGATVHKGGTLVCIEGPAFSTHAESEFYRRCGMDIIGMTSLQEAKLSREAEICYAANAIVTDYDCWHEEEGDVNVATVVETLKKNVATAKEIIKSVAAGLPEKRDCICADALKNAIMTEVSAIPEKVVEDLGPIIGSYVR